MSARAVTLVDRSRRAIAAAQVHEQGGRYCGHIDLGPMPPPLRQVFAEFEEIVNGQMLSFLDEIEARIEAFGLRVVLENGREVPIEDLQIYPAAGKVSFRLAQGTAAPGNPA